MDKQYLWERNVKTVTDEFEQALDAYLERREYDRAAETLYTLVRGAFMAGWLAAGGAQPARQPVIRLVPKKTPEQR